MSLSPWLTAPELNTTKEDEQLTEVADLLFAGPAVGILYPASSSIAADDRPSLVRQLASNNTESIGLPREFLMPKLNMRSLLFRRANNDLTTRKCLSKSLPDGPGPCFMQMMWVVL